MGFRQVDVDALLAQTGRMCAICNRLHGVQVHHIRPKHEGGSDARGNAIPLCPNCHDEVHVGYHPGRTTRVYTEHELRGHLKRTIDLASRQSALTVGSPDWNHDVALVKFYATCLDRPAFRTHFHQELSFADFDRALEDTTLAINTGFWRTRDGTLIERSEGKRHLVRPEFRDAMDLVVGAIEAARQELRSALGLDRMLMEQFRVGPRWLDLFDVDLRSDRALGQRMDDLRQNAIDAMNVALGNVGLPLLKRIGDWT